MSKKPLVIGNWKMELTQKGAQELAKSVVRMAGSKRAAEVVLCPSFPALSAVAEAAKASGVVEVGAQAIHWEEKGAFTGFVSVAQIRDFVKWCLVGHSEQRQYAGETEESVAWKTHRLLEEGITPVVCVGETAQERAADEVLSKIQMQMDTLLNTVPRTSVVKTVIAYEPIWAIGTGQLPEPNDVAEVILLMRKLIANRYDGGLADRVRILYGGSVKPENVGDYISGPGADGALVGGASLTARSFMEIVEAVERAWDA